MIFFPRPLRPLALPKQLIPNSPIRSFTMSSQQQQHPRTQPPKPPAKKEKRPQLTHFLCLPLINSTSLPQLESSLAAFKADIASTTTPPNADHPANPPQPLIPDAAIRPLGTLHLTLGVMSLPNKERLDAAIQLLRSLDLVALMREAETIARACAHTQGGRRKRGHRVPAPASTREAEASGASDGSNGPGLVMQEGKEELVPSPPSPFTLSLESLHALPRARSATVLHAEPVDSSSRLYPFCEMLRDRFLDAGFLQGEFKKDDTSQQQQKQHQQEGNVLEEMPAEVAGDVAKESAPLVTGTPASSDPQTKPKLKPRPLLLHATVVNTIYIKGRSRNAGGGKSRKNNRYSFDVRDLIARYRDYYLDSDRTIPRPSSTTNEVGQKDGDEDLGDAVENEHENEEGNRSTALNPFVWARDFPIESVCICEMGAKKLDPEGDEDGLNARLGEKYMVVAERGFDL